MENKELSVGAAYLVGLIEKDFENSELTGTEQEDTLSSVMSTLDNLLQLEGLEGALRQMWWDVEVTDEEADDGGYGLSVGERNPSLR